jgi:hypothetical protein
LVAAVLVAMAMRTNTAVTSLAHQADPAPFQAVSLSLLLEAEAGNQEALRVTLALKDKPAIMALAAQAQPNTARVGTQLRHTLALAVAAAVATNRASSIQQVEQVLVASVRHVRRALRLLSMVPRSQSLLVQAASAGLLLAKGTAAGAAPKATPR